MNKSNEQPKVTRRDENENLSPGEIRATICSIKRKVEEEFQEELKHMTPEEREKAIEFANALL